MKDQYRKKPVIIDAYQLPAAGEDVPVSFHEWCQKVGFDTFESGRDETLIIPTLEGGMTAAPGDWIIKGVKGEFYPCKPDIFAATYEPAEADRQRRGEPVAVGLRNLLERCREFIDTTTCPAYPAGTDIADDIDAFLAPQPTEPVKVPSDAELQAAQEVFEKWFCEELGLDIDSKESEAIIRKMLTSALLARYGVQSAARAEPVGEAYLFEPTATRGAFTHCVFDSKVVPEGAKLYAAPVAEQPTGKSPLQVAAQPMVDIVPPATSRDRWMYEQGRLAERDPRTAGSLAAQIAAQPSVQDGWKLVPVEPTWEMESAAEDYWNSKRFEAFSSDPRTWAGIYATMLAATPPATNQEK